MTIRSEQSPDRPSPDNPADLARRGLFAQLASDHSPDVQLVVDPLGNIRYVGGNVGHIGGLTVDQVMTTPMWDFVHPDDLESAAGALNEATRSEGYHMPTCVRIRGGDGEWVDVELTGTTFEGDGGAWLIIPVRPTGGRGETLARRRILESLVRESSTACASVSWHNVDDVVASFTERLVETLGARSFSMGWEVDGVMRHGAFWPIHCAPPDTAVFEQIWPRSVLVRSLLQFSDDLAGVPRSMLADRMIADGLRAVVEIPLTEDAPWGVGRFTFRDSAKNWDDANVDLVKVLVRTLMSTVRRCAAERTMQYQATTDHLTGLMNRPELYRTLEQFLAESSGDGTVAVFFGDLDNFKMLNDLRGHDAGDRVLQSVADALRRSVRAVDVIARIGGDEFIVVCPDIEDSDQLDHIRRRILEAVGGIDTMGVPVEMSLGVALAAPDETGRSILDRADRLMYRTKRGASRDRRRLPSLEGQFA